MRKVGVWIDHTKAVVVTIEAGNETLETVESGVGRHAGPSGGSGTATPWAPHGSNREHARERQYEQHLVKYYRGVIGHLGQPDQMILFGPARAKNELKAELDKTPLRDVATTLETTDEMTDAQIRAYVRAFEM